MQRGIKGKSTQRSTHSTHTGSATNLANFSFYSVQSERKVRGVEDGRIELEPSSFAQGMLNVLVLYSIVFILKFFYPLLPHPSAQRLYFTESIFAREYKDTTSTYIFRTSYAKMKVLAQFQDTLLTLYTQQIFYPLSPVVIFNIRRGRQLKAAFKKT